MRKRNRSGTTHDSPSIDIIGLLADIAIGRSEAEGSDGTSEGGERRLPRLVPTYPDGGSAVLSVTDAAKRVGSNRSLGDKSIGSNAFVVNIVLSAQLSDSRLSASQQKKGEESSLLMTELLRVSEDLSARLEESQSLWLTHTMELTSSVSLQAQLRQAGVVGVSLLTDVVYTRGGRSSSSCTLGVLCFTVADAEETGRGGDDDVGLAALMTLVLRTSLRLASPWPCTLRLWMDLEVLQNEGYAALARAIESAAATCSQQSLNVVRRGTLEIVSVVRSDEDDLLECSPQTGKVTLEPAEVMSYVPPAATTTSSTSTTPATTTSSATATDTTTSPTFPSLLQTLSESIPTPPPPHHTETSDVTTQRLSSDCGGPIATSTAMPDIVSLTEPTKALLEVGAAPPVSQQSGADTSQETALLQSSTSSFVPEPLLLPDGGKPEPASSDVAAVAVLSQRTTDKLSLSDRLCELAPALLALGTGLVSRSPADGGRGEHGDHDGSYTTPHASPLLLLEDKQAPPQAAAIGELLSQIPNASNTVDADPIPIIDPDMLFDDMHVAEEHSEDDVPLSMLFQGEDNNPASQTKRNTQNKEKKKPYNSNKNSNHISLEPLPYTLPFFMATLFIEATASTHWASDSELRDLIVQWYSLVDEDALTEEARRGSKASLPPPHRRIVVLVADDIVTLRRALLSWTERPFAEHALMLPILGVSSDSEGEESVAKRKRPLRSEALQNALLHACNAYNIDVDRSLALIQSEDMREALESLEFPSEGITREIRVCRDALAEQGGHTVFSSASVDSAALSRIRLEERMRSWCGLLQDLCSRPRRPEIIFRRITPRVRRKGHKRGAKVPTQRVCFGAVRPPIASSDACTSVMPRDVRVKSAHAPVLTLPTNEVRVALFRFLKRFFSPEVFHTAVNVSKVNGAGYFSSYSCRARDYLVYDVTCSVGPFLTTCVTVDLQPLLRTALRGEDPAWQSLLPNMSCTCTPRSFEKVLYTEDGQKKCRHLAETIYLFILRQLQFPDSDAP